MSWNCCIRLIERCLPRNDVARELRPYLRNSSGNLAGRSFKSKNHIELVDPPLENAVIVILSITSVRRLIAQHPDLMEHAIELFQHLVRSHLQDHSGYEVEYTAHRFTLVFPRSFDAAKYCMTVQLALKQAAWDRELVESIREVAEERTASGKLIFRGMRVRMGIHQGEDLDIATDHFTGKTAYSGGAVEIAKKVGFYAFGGQIVVSEPVWIVLKEQLIQLGNPVVEDLGIHILEEYDEPIQLMQIMPKELEGRRFPRLMSFEQIGYGMRDAPATSGNVTMVFTYIDGLRNMILSDAHRAVKCIEHFCVSARTLLRQYGGYECQELQGEFMLAFFTPIEAVIWAGQVQRLVERRGKEWSNDCSDFQFEVSIGIEMGVPTSVAPHKTSGRADYFGNIVNHTARIAKSANGGQILIGSEAWKCISTDIVDVFEVETRSSATVKKYGPKSYLFNFTELGKFWYKGISSSTLIAEARKHGQDVRSFPAINAKRDDTYDSGTEKNPTKKMVIRCPVSIIRGTIRDTELRNSNLSIEMDDEEYEDVASVPMDFDVVNVEDDYVELPSPKSMPVPNTIERV